VLVAVLMPASEAPETDPFEGERTSNWEEPLRWEGSAEVLVPLLAAEGSKKSE
jgi:hypothetical protein